MRRAGLAAWLALTGCGRSSQGTIVGNPGDAMVRLAEGSGVGVTSALLPLEDVSFTDCGDATLELDRLGTLDVAAGDPLPLEPGRWCGLSLGLEAPLVVTGRVDGSGTFDLRLDVEEIALGGGEFRVDTRSRYVIELGGPGWIDASDFDLTGTADDELVEPGHPLHDALAAAIAEESTLFEDLDGDGAVDPDERDGAALTGPGGDGSGGCGDGQAAFPLGLLLPLVFGAAKRSRSASRSRRTDRPVRNAGPVAVGRSGVV